MASKTGKQIITIRRFSNISRSKSNQAIKFGQLIEYNRGKFFFKKIMQKMKQTLVPDLFCFCIKSFI